MIRLLALRKVMENVSAEEATLLSIGSTSYIALCKLLPWIYPKEDWRDLVQAQLLCGIKPRHINARLSEPLTQTQLCRIRRFSRMPEAEYVKDDLASLDEYITVTQQFYANILRPLQFQDYAPNLTPYAKWWLVKSKARESALAIIYIQDQAKSELITLMQSMPAGNKGEMLCELGTSSVVCRMLNTTQSNCGKFQTLTDPRGHELALQYEQQVSEIWDLIYRIRIQGIMNDALMEGKYADIFTRR